MIVRLFTIVFLIVFTANACYSQTRDNLRTEVFTLSTCDPNTYSLRKEVGNDRAEEIRKLESRNRKSSILHITGINPLRYKYYINNEAVTQFMETAPLPLSINTFVSGNYLTSVPELRVPEIFKTDSISSKARHKIQQFQNEFKKIEDSIAVADARIDQRWSFLLDSMRTKFPDTPFYNLQMIARETAFKDRSYNMLLTDAGQKLLPRERHLREFKKFTSGLPLNNPKFGILVQYQNLSYSSNMGEIDSIKKYQKDFAEEYLEHINRFKRIERFLERNVFDTVINSQVSEDLEYYNFAWTPRSNIDNSYAGRRDNSSDIAEQILAKQFQIYEEFVLNVATRVGVLVQNIFLEYSSFNNSLGHFVCMDSLLLDSVKKRRTRLINTFDFIQKTSAELQILVSHLDINTELYQNIARKINTNYILLLGYLKNLDFLYKENTELYTLPTHTNSNNIDFIRYTVKREDKITNNFQTYNYDFWIRGGLKVDFSFGFFGTRLTDNVYNKVLLDTAGGIDKIRITRQDDGRANFAFGGMVNITQRNGASWLNVGGSIGVAYSNNQKLQVLSGISLHLGKTERLIIHGGAAFGQIKYLDISANDFKFFDRDLNSIEREKLGDIKEKKRVYMLQSPDIKFSSYVVPTVDKFVIRPFVGISYNLSKKNALQAVSGTGVKTFSGNYNDSVGY